MSTHMASFPSYDGGSSDNLHSFQDAWYHDHQNSQFHSMSTAFNPDVEPGSMMQAFISSSNCFVSPEYLGVFPPSSTSSTMDATSVEEEAYVVPVTKGHKRRKASRSFKGTSSPDTEPKEPYHQHEQHEQYEQQKQAQQPLPINNLPQEKVPKSQKQRKRSEISTPPSPPKNKSTTAEPAAAAVAAAAVSSSSFSTISSSSHRKVTEPVRRERNRTAAAKCRAKSKVAEEELRELQRIERNRNQMLRAAFEELSNETLALKHELLCHSTCNHPVIDRYLLRSAEEISSGISSRSSQQQQQQQQQKARQGSSGSPRD